MHHTPAAAARTRRDIRINKRRGRSAGGAEARETRTSLVPAALVALALSGCSAFSTSVPGRLPPRAPAAQDVGAARGGLLFVSTGRQNLIDIYEAATPHRRVGTITNGLDGPNGEAIDSESNLYVANADGGTVTVYAPGEKTPARIYKKGLSNPLTPAVGNDGTLYVSNFNPDGSGTILEYRPGQLTPFFEIPLPGGAIGIALDASNDLYATTYGKTGRILEFRPHSKHGKDLGIRLGFAGRILVDKRGNVIVCDQIAPAVDVFPPGATKPSKRITSGFSDPFALALNAKSTRLYVADGAGDTVTVYSYPQLKLVSTIDRGLTSYGLAIDRPTPPQGGPRSGGYIGRP